jgi:hypothetical protein
LSFCITQAKIKDNLLREVCNMLTRILLFFFLCWMHPAFAITCYMTIAKDSCWTKYDVEIDVIDSTADTLLTTVKIPKGQQWTRQTFPCKPAQKMAYVARFSPVFWQTDAGKSYSALRSWGLPETIHPGDTAWNVSVCYPADFAMVPFPPEGTGKCACDFTNIPEIKPQ